MSKQRDEVQALFDQWNDGEIEKYDFYAATMSYNIHLVSQVTGISRPVIYDRRRYLKQLASQSKGL